MNLSSGINNERTESQDLNIFVKEMLEDMETKFVNTGESIMGRLEEISKKMDILDNNISDLMDEAGLSQQPISSEIHVKGSPPPTGNHHQKATTNSAVL